MHIALITLVVSTLSVAAQQQFSIAGTASFATGEELRLLIFDDLVNGTPMKAASDIIDKNGRFALKYKTNDVKVAQIAIRNTKADLFIAPSVNYNLTLDVDTLLFNMVNPEKYGGMIRITNPNTDTADLNYKINRFASFYESLLSEYSYRMIYDNDANAFDSVRAYVKRYFPVEYNPDNFYISYIFYTLGTIDVLQYRKKSALIYEKYFNNDHILYDNPAYMSLFNQFYSGYLYTSPKISKAILTKTINEDPDYLALFNEVGKDPMLTNARLRELVIIKNLAEFLDNKEFDRGNVIKLLNYIQTTSSFERHKDIVKNTLSSVERKTKAAENIVFTNEKDKKIPLKHFAGKPVYLYIFQTDCIDCIREMVILNELHKKYNEKIDIVSLCIDPKKNDYEKFLKKYKKMFEMPVLYFNSEYDWLLSEGIETLPDFILYNSNGGIQMRYAPSPEKGLPEYLQQNFTKEEKIEENPLFYKRTN